MDRKPIEKVNGVVTLNYNDLVSGADVTDAIEEAYGFGGLGLLLVRGAPNFVELRANLLALAPRYAALPDAIKEKTVHAVSHYSFGWSHGKEILKPGQFDTFKGSYYNNPQYDVPFDDAELISKYPEVCHPNIWPKEDFPELEPAFKTLGSLMVDVGVLVARQCDAYVKRQLPGYPGLIENIIQTSKTCKARLLNYFPVNEDQTLRTRESWCGWHNDHSSLTGLCPAMYFKVDGDRVVEQDIPCPDAEAGLWARTRNGQEVKVNVPRDCIAYQIGESSQVQTGGVILATPHAVQAISYPLSINVARATFAVFMQPNIDVALDLPQGRSLQQAQVGQYRPGMTFADFSKATIDNYYTER